MSIAIAAVPDHVLRVYALYMLGDRSREETLRQIRELRWGELSEKGLRTTVKPGTSGALLGALPARPARRWCRADESVSSMFLQRAELKCLEFLRETGRFIEH